MKPRAVVTGRTVFIPLIGHPVEQVKSPGPMNAWFADRGIDAVVVPMDIRPERVASFFDVMRATANCVGCSVTVPHKQAAFLASDEVTERARRVKAVNTIRRSPSGRLIGDMTDGQALVAALQSRGERVEGAAVLLVGAGAAGTAIALELAEKGVASLVVIERDPMRQRALTNELADAFPAVRVSDALRPGQSIDIAINASTVGMQPGDPLPYPVEPLSGARIFADAVTKVDVTPWLVAAKRQGHPILVGEEMAVAQLPIQLGYFRFPGAGEAMSTGSAWQGADA